MYLCDSPSLKGMVLSGSGSIPRGNTSGTRYPARRKQTKALILGCFTVPVCVHICACFCPYLNTSLFLLLTGLSFFAITILPGNYYFYFLLFVWTSIAGVLLWTVFFFPFFSKNDLIGQGPRVILKSVSRIAPKTQLSECHVAWENSTNSAGNPPPDQPCNTPGTASC